MTIVNEWLDRNWDAVKLLGVGIIAVLISVIVALKYS